MRAMFSPFGRSGRLMFWLIILFLGQLYSAVVFLLPFLVLPALGVDLERFLNNFLSSEYIALTAMMGFWGLFSLYPTFNIMIRRLHDLGRSGWWFLLFLLPMLVFALMIIGPYLGLIMPYSLMSVYPSFLGYLLKFFIIMIFVFIIYLGFFPGVSEPNKYGQPKKLKSLKERTS